MAVRLVCALLLALGCSDRDGADRPIYPKCDAIERDLGALAAHYDTIAVRDHLPAGQDLIHAVVFGDDLTTVVGIDLSDNAGSWSAIYGASQAYRWAVTEDPEALENVRRILRGMETLTRVTEVPGLFARAYVNLDLPIFPNEQQLLASYPDCNLDEAHCKRWTKVTEGEFENVMFKNDVSKDEYVGHMFTLGAMAKLVDDPEVQSTVRTILFEVARHLIDHDLQLVDIDGRTTEFGYMNPLSLNDFPGFNALLVLSWIRVAATVTADPDLLSFYENCLLHRDLAACAKPALATSDPYPTHLELMGLDLDCTTNWNNHHMAQLAMFSLLDYEQDPNLRRQYQQILDHQMFSADDPRPMRIQENAMFTFFWEIGRPKESAFPEPELETARCVLEQFPEVKYHRAVDNSGHVEVCRDRKDRPLTDTVIPFAEREIDNYMWKTSPFTIEVEPEDRKLVESPEDFLLAYWIGRYHGIIEEGD